MSPKTKHKQQMKYVPHLPKRRLTQAEISEEAVKAIPRITNETVAEHREEVLGSARKLIYPLQHSKRRVVVVSLSILTMTIIVFFVGCSLALYKFHDTSAFIYDVTKVIPFPIAKADNRYVAYENYLFELRRYVHYYENQQKLDFSTKDGQTQLANQRQQALAKVENDAYVKVLAKQNNVTVSDREVEDEVVLLRAENRLGSSDEVFENVLKEYWGWSVADFKRELKTQLLAQKVAAALDTQTQQNAKDALAAVKQGADFKTVVAQYSDDEQTKANGGDYGAPIDKNNQDLSPYIIDQLFKLEVGQTSDIVQTSTNLQILKVTSREGDNLSFARIVCTFKDVSEYTKPLREQFPPKAYVNL